MGFKNTLFFGKKYENLSTEKKIKHLENHLIFAQICLLIISIISILIIFSFVFNVFSKESYNDFEFNGTVTYENLTYEEQNNAESTLYGIKDYYLDGIKSITFSKNISKYSKIVDNKTIGLYYNGNIYILYIKNTDSMRSTLAHEILHRWIKDSSGEDPLSSGHKIVYDMGEISEYFMFKKRGEFDE